MKAIKILMLLLMVVSVSCKKTTVDPDEDKGLTGDAAINDWIYDQMKAHYLWTDQMPAKDPLALKKDPETYFETLLNQYGVVDRFSWIEASSEELKNSFQGITKSYGYKFSAFTNPTATDQIMLSVRYPVKNGPADRAGLKRGDIITKIDGKTLTKDNWVALAYPDQPTTQTLTLSSYANKVLTEKAAKITIAAEQVTEDPILLSKVITKGNKKIGYVVFNQYINTAETALRTLFGSFKSQGINELVVDLRYNGGGYVSTAQVLSSLIGKGVGSSKTFARYEYNATQAKVQKDKYGNNWDIVPFKTEPNNIGSQLSRVYFIITRSSASASEMTVNALKPFMDVVLVGDNSYGKNVGSYTIEDSQKRWNWGLQPITFKTYNSANQSDYGTTAGFTPNIAQKENSLPFAQLGDETETLLAKALENITGIVPVQARLGVQFENTEVREPLKASSIRFNMLK